MSCRRCGRTSPGTGSRASYAGPAYHAPSAQRAAAKPVQSVSPRAPRYQTASAPTSAPPTDALAGTFQQLSSLKPGDSRAPLSRARSTAAMCSKPSLTTAERSSLRLTAGKTRPLAALPSSPCRSVLRHTCCAERVGLKWREPCEESAQRPGFEPRFRQLRLDRCNVLETVRLDHQLDACLAEL